MILLIVHRVVFDGFACISKKFYLPVFHKNRTVAVLFDHAHTMTHKNNCSSLYP